MTNNKTKNHPNTQRIAGVAILTAIVVVLQYLGGSIKFGAFSISLVLVPIVTGAILFGAAAGAWLGCAFGIAVLLSGDAALFMAVNPIAAIFLCILKGALAGLAAGGIYSLFHKLSEDKEREVGYLRDENGKKVYTLVKQRGKAFKKTWGIVCVFAAAVVAPIVNTGVFLLGCRLFFMKLLVEWAAGKDVLVYMMTAFVGVNFLIEMGVNLVLSPVIIRLVDIGKKTFGKK